MKYVSMNNSEIISHLVKYRDRIINDKIKKGLVPNWSGHRLMSIDAFIELSTNYSFEQKELTLEEREESLKNLINSHFPDPSEPDNDNPAKKYADCLNILDHKEV